MKTSASEKVVHNVPSNELMSISTVEPFYVSFCFVFFVFFTFYDKSTAFSVTYENSLMLFCCETLYFFWEKLHQPHHRHPTPSTQGCVSYDHFLGDKLFL